MEFKERVVDGVLCYRLIADSAFVPYTPKQLSAMLIGSRLRENHLPLMVDGSQLNPHLFLPDQPVVPFSEPIDPYMQPACDEG